MDIRLALAEEIAASIGAVIIPELRCGRNIGYGPCRWPLMAKPEQGMLMFCWGCTTDNRTAHEGRTALTRAKLAAQGVMIGHDHTHFSEAAPL